MTALLNLNSIDLEKLPIKDYFKTIESALDKNNTVDMLTDFFSSEAFSETKPNLIRRQLKPADRRFKQIELVYKNPNRIKEIIWDLDIFLSQLIEIFGEPIIHNEPYSDSTAFAFKSDNTNVEIITTRYPKWLTKLKLKNAFEYQDKNLQKVELSDPEFSFIQFSISL